MKPPALHARVTTAADDLSALLARLEAELPEKYRKPYGAGAMPRGGDGPLASWNSSVAYLVMEIHSGLREIETNLRYMVAGVLRNHGGGDGVTRAILDRVADLTAGASTASATAVAVQLEKWCYRARLALGESEPLARMPRLPGAPEPPCPYCGRTSIRYQPSSGVLTCVNPGCRDRDGKRTRGRVEVGRYTGEPRVAWQDGSSGFPETA